MDDGFLGWLSTTAVVLADVVDPIDDQPGQGVYLDLLNLQWWQALLGIAAAAGLSPAPWILGLATGKIQFSGPAREDLKATLAAKDEVHAAATAALVAAHTTEVKNLTTYHADLMAVKDERYAEAVRAADIEKQRADSLESLFTELAGVLKANVHVLGSLNEVAREAAAT